jgi:hypothetical protein
MRDGTREQDTQAGDCCELCPATLPLANKKKKKRESETSPPRVTSSLQNPPEFSTLLSRSEKGHLQERS